MVRSDETKSEAGSVVRGPLLAKPSRHPFLDLFLAQYLSLGDLSPPALDLLPDVEVVLDILEGGLVWEVIEQFPYLLLGCLHGLLLSLSGGQPERWPPFEIEVEPPDEVHMLREGGENVL